MPEPLTFPDFFLFGMLRSMKWPRKTGLLVKKETVDPRIVDNVRFQLCQLGVTLGAGRPRLAAQLLADVLFHRDWAKEPFGELLADLNLDPDPNGLPWESIVAARLAKTPDLRVSESVPWAWLERRELRAIRHMEFAAGLVWGLLHPSETIVLLDRLSAEGEEDVPRARRAGLHLDDGFSVPNAEESFQHAEEMVVSYQEECRPLVSLPTALADSPEISARLTADPIAELENTVFELVMITSALIQDGWEEAAGEALPRARIFDVEDEVQGLILHAAFRFIDEFNHSESALDALREIAVKQTTRTVVERYPADKMTREDAEALREFVPRFAADGLALAESADADYSRAPVLAAAIGHVDDESAVAFLNAMNQDLAGGGDGHGASAVARFSHRALAAGRVEPTQELLRMLYLRAVVNLSSTDLRQKVKAVADATT